MADEQLGFELQGRLNELEAKMEYIKMQKQESKKRLSTIEYNRSQKSKLHLGANFTGAGFATVITSPSTS